MGGEEFGFEECQAIGIYHVAGIVVELYIIVTIILVAAGLQRSGEENFGDYEVVGFDIAVRAESQIIASLRYGDRLLPGAQRGRDSIRK